MSRVWPASCGERSTRVALVLLACAATVPARAQDAPQTPDKPVVTMPDGVQAGPLNSTMVIHPDPQCPAMARFRADSISYTEWANRKVVSTWTNTTETFLECVEGDPGAPPAPPEP